MIARVSDLLPQRILDKSNPPRLSESRVVSETWVEALVDSKYSGTSIFDKLTAVVKSCFIVLSIST